MISKIATIALGLVSLGSSVFAQSLADAKKAIDAEQYQKAKTMLKNLTVTQAKEDENFFQLGWVYILQDYPDSAKAVFTQGLAVNPKSALNYVGLGVVARLNKDNAGATSNFNQAISFTGKKESQPYLYIGRGYLMRLPNTKAVATADADAAIAALSKGKLANPKDAEVALELGNAYRAKRETSPAYENYTTALTLDPKSPAANVAQGVLWSNAHNFEDAVKQYQAAIAIDPNFGPAYREWAETDLNWSFENRAVAVEKINEGVANFKKYMSLTDQSDETLMRYADFLISAGKYKELQEVAAQLSKSTNSNARALRYLGYAAYENKDYQAGITALNNWFAKAGPNRILPRDYMYQGRLQIASGKDTTAGITTIRKAIELDSTLASDGYNDILAVHKKKGDYLGQARTYEEITQRVRNRSTFADKVYSGIYYYYAFQYGKPQDSTLLAKADTALSQSMRASATPAPDVFLFKARIADLKDLDRNNIKGIAKPFYEKFIEISAAKANPDNRTKTNLGEAYAYLGAYAEYKDKDEAKALEYYTKGKEADPSNKQVAAYFARKTAAPSKGK